MSGESRVDLLNWVNDLLQLNYTKVEQLGSGAAYCQIIDSIYLDLPMSRVKFDASKEYEYLNNFKVLQSAFLRHKIQKTIPVEKLIKCKFQDNLEFFQWIRKFWKENKDEADYDPNLRRKSLPSATPRKSNAPIAPVSGSSRRNVSSSSTNSISSSTLPKSRTASQSSLSASRVSSNNDLLTKELNQTRSELSTATNQIHELNLAIEALETERNFYFNKLREIEILTESTNEQINDEKSPTLKEILIQIQEILYTTEEGFQAPEDDELQQAHDINMEETF
ncbi:hypothetical protein WICMUC_000298 [Wickerhamomyces mucosus]|uniref:Calponin-homology (CH) domain-containing protein n=1 Tax=Wickerhamomyces mucosus TaxID=1378264 RepID=A0A9P8PXU0_9ASCO|nr:hypothetical protein WICMUC_000298 [Wickerhamomyces mucosus]